MFGDLLVGVVDAERDSGVIAPFLVQAGPSHCSFPTCEVVTAILATPHATDCSKPCVAEAMMDQMWTRTRSTSGARSLDGVVTVFKSETQV